MKRILNSDASKKIIPWVISIAMFMEALDATIVGVAIPNIAKSFAINPINLKLAMTSYLLSLAIFIPISGWLADKYQAKKVFIFAMIVFTCGSIFCALSPSLPLLVASRMLQGFGGALMVPVGRLIMMRIFSKAELVKAMAAVILPALIGPALGPTIGGLILKIASWHWVFLVNIPFGIAGAIIAYFFITETQSSSPQQAFNWLGFLLFSSGLTLITVAMALLGDNFSLFSIAMEMAAMGLVLLIIYIYYSKKQAYPLLDLSLFKKTTFAVSMAVNFFARIGTGALPFILPLLLQVVWKKSALYSGLIFMALALGMLFSRALISEKLLMRMNYRKFLLITMVTISLLSMNLCWFSQPLPAYLLAGLLFVIGVLTTQLYMSFGILYRFELEPPQFSQAASIASTIQQFSAGFGVATAAIVLHLVSKISTAPLFSGTVFFWSFIILNVTGLISVFFIMKLSTDIRLKA